MGSKFFFMHIAKTAGSYINQVISDHVGADKVILHGEMKIRGHDHFVELVEKDGIEVVSGHIYLRLWDEFAKHLRTDFKLTTALRNPIDHMASHILWLDHYNLPEKKGEYNRLNEAQRRVVDLIGQTDLSSSGDLDHFVTHMPAAAIQLLDNCQSRYFLCGPGSPIKNFEPITLAHSSAILQAYNRFDVVMLQDDLDEGIKLLNSAMEREFQPSDMRVNEAKSSRKIDTTNPVIRSILCKRLIVDQWLWRLSQARNNERRNNKAKEDAALQAGSESKEAVGS